MLHKRSTTVFP